MTSKYDISELYDYIRSRQGTYAVTFDASHLMEINDTLGREAGDKVILECIRRIDRECSDGMMMFRIGGDEFVMMTGLSDRAEVAALAGKILAHNGESVSHGGTDIPVSMRAGAVMLRPGKLSYSELFTELVSAPAEIPGKCVSESGRPRRFTCVNYFGGQHALSSFCEIISKTILTLWEICDKIIIYSFEKRYLYDRYRFRPCRLRA